MNTTIKKIIGPLFAAIGIIILLFMIGELVGTYRFMKRAERAQGKVVALNAGGSHPEITFIKPDGQSISYPQGGLVFGYKVGDSVTVFYDEQNPTQATVKSFGAMWGFLSLGMILGAAFVIAGLYEVKNSRNLNDEVQT